MPLGLELQRFRKDLETHAARGGDLEHFYHDWALLGS